MSRAALGHIDCPACGGTHTMRVTHDKNGDPFGHCEACSQQLRVGGNARRVAQFVARHPWAKNGGEQATTPAPAPAAPKQPAPPAPKKRPDPFAFLLGGAA